MKTSFHVRFTKRAFVSHFMPIPMKRETKGHFRFLLPMRDVQKKDETRLRKNSGSRFAGTCSRFTPFHVSFHSSARCREQTSGQALLSVLAIVAIGEATARAMSLNPVSSIPDYSHVYGTRKSFPVYGSFTTDPDAKPVTSTYFPFSGV